MPAVKDQVPQQPMHHSVLDRHRDVVDDQQTIYLLLGVFLNLLSDALQRLVVEVVVHLVVVLEDVVS